MDNELQLFESRRIRSAWNEEEGQYYFSIVDIVGALTNSRNPRSYWSVLKSRLKKEGNQTATNCRRLKLKSPDGKMRMTDVANTEQLLRIIQSIPSPKAEPLKLWLAQTGADHLVELAANLFRITQAEAKLAREGIHDKQAANRAHFEVGHAVRRAIAELGGTMPEDLPTPEKSIRQLEREKKKNLSRGPSKDGLPEGGKE